VILQNIYKRINKLQQLLFPVGLITAIASRITLVSLSVHRSPFSKRGFTEGDFFVVCCGRGRQKEGWAGAQSQQVAQF
jgi:hypothetical protein